MTVKKLIEKIKSAISGRLFSKKFLLKYFILLYILIVLTSLISASIIFYLSNKSIENEVHNRDYVLLENEITAMDNIYQDMVSELIYFQSQDITKKFSNEIINGNRFYYSPNMDIISLLGKLKGKHTGIVGVILFFKGNNYLFSPDGMNTFNSYFKNVLHIDNGHLDALKDKLTSLDAINVVNTSSISESGNSGKTTGEKGANSDYVIMSIPLTIYGNMGMTVSLLLDSQFFNFIANNYNETDSSLTILDSDGKLLISIGENILENDDIQKNMDKINSGLNKLRIKTAKGPVSVTVGKSNLIKWTYISAVPYTYVTSQTRHIKSIMLYMMLIFIILGFAAAYKLGNWQYKPIQTLTEYVNNTLGSPENRSYDTLSKNDLKKNNGKQQVTANKTNEFTYIKQSIGYLQTLNTNMKQFIDGNMSILKQNTIYKLFHGLYNKDNFLEEDFEKYNIDLHNNSYIVLILNYVKNKSVSIPINEYFDIRNSITGTVMKFVNKRFQGYSAEIDMENSAVIVGIDKDSDVSELKGICEYVVDFFNSQLNVVRLTIGISKKTNSIFCVPKCYTEALNIINSRSISSLSEVVAYDLYFFGETSISAKELKIYDIISNIMNGMCDEAAGEFLKAVQNIFVNNPTYSQLINVSTILHKEINNFLLYKDVSHEDVKQLEIILLSELNSIYTINEFEERIKAYFNGIREIFDNSLTPDRNNIIENVKTYVREHYSDPDLYLGKVALDMNITANYISHTFKAGTGMSFPEYLTTIRMEKAKELLTNTQEQINDIGFKCGYINISTFMRSFKNIVGTSPGKYRSMYGNRQ